MQVLGIETSCDETAAAVIDDRWHLKSNVVASQVEIHRPHWGVVPEIASRHHLELVIPVVEEALGKAGCTIDDIEGVAVTYGPGLMGSLLVGLTIAKGISWVRDLPFIGVNHLEAHLTAAYLDYTGLRAPFVGLIVSGGHTDLLAVPRPGRYRYLGSTRDDAAGEAFDKVARLLGLGYPGGPAIEAAARRGSASSIDLPRPRFKDDALDFSFSGLKTAVRYYVEDLRAKHHPLPVADVAASFQLCVSRILLDRITAALKRTGFSRVVLGGGVCANQYLRQYLAGHMPSDVQLYVPNPSLCTDNAAMVAASGKIRMESGERSPFTLEVAPALMLDQHTPWLERK